MLGEAELQDLGGHLRTFLLESYNRLKSGYEEEKEVREKYKKLAKTQVCERWLALERGLFELVLFKDYLIKAGAQIGVQAAQLFSDSIKDLVQERLGSEAYKCRIMVRIYANLLGLSKTLTRAGDLFDYVDAGDKKEGADYKIRDIFATRMFRPFADNTQCKHMFFAGCHGAGYRSLLTPYRGRADRITLIKGAFFHHEFHALDLPVRELSTVFMSMHIGGSPIPTGPSTTKTTRLPTTNVSTAKVCTHYQKGMCHYGNRCTKQHIDAAQQLSRKLDNSVSSGFYSATRPYMNPNSVDLISVNKNGERIDAYVPTPLQDSWDKYAQRSKPRRPCNNHHLAGSCDNESCEFDHTSVDSQSLSVMKYILRQRVCTTGARCRLLMCFYGHRCQIGGCKGIKPCKFGPHAHTLDLDVARWEEPSERHVSDDSPASEASSNIHSLDDWSIRPVIYLARYCSGDELRAPFT
ncbi:hypothetical protein BJY04DRAFT_211679 [Aspergillus karnatakaensis]|uniref:uncharacterized protein n=1 Tax=Aspergillus karnatakaensis TaxID=1810916 RepID=UPI003CCD02F6